MKAVNGWSQGIQNAIEYIEENITDRLEINDIASKAYVSAFHFQRIFSILCGYTIAEYIRNRRLTLAGQRLSVSDTILLTVLQEPLQGFTVFLLRLQKKRVQNSNHLHL